MAKTKAKPAKKPTPAKKPMAKKTDKMSAKSKPKVVAKSPAKKAMPKVTPKAKAPVKSAKPAAKSLKPSRPTPLPTAAWSVPTPANKKPESFFKSYLKPLDDRIVVLVSESAKITPGGLYIPDTVTDVSGNYQGKVMAIGRGHMNKKGKVKPLDVSVGDSVVFSQFSGSQMDLDGSNVMIIRESDVLGIVK